MPRLNDETIATLTNNFQKLSTIVLHNYVCGDNGQAAANFLSTISSLKRLEFILNPYYFYGLNETISSLKRCFNTL